MPKKPSENEDDFVARMEYERMKKLEEEKQRDIAEEEKNRLKELHFMKCPKCGMELISLYFRGIEVDKCSGCQGIWLDAGEFELLAGLEKSGLDKLFSVFRR